MHSQHTNCLCLQKKIHVSIPKTPAPNTHLGKMYTYIVNQRRCTHRF